MIDMKCGCLPNLRKAAVFAAIIGAFEDELAKRWGNVAHQD